MINLKKNLILNLSAPGKFEFSEIDLPEKVKSDYARVMIEYCGICGTDLSFYHGHRVEGYPICLGHEHCGTVIELGKDVVNIKVGDFVAIDPNFRCGECKYCKNKLGHLCNKFAINLFSNRGYAKYQDIHCSYLHILPNFKSRFHGALVEPLSVAINSIDVSGLNEVKDLNILILGVGALGSLLVFTLLSIFKNLKISIYDKNLNRMEKLKNIYGERIICLENLDQYESSFDYIFEVTGHSSGFYSGCRALVKSGTLTIVSRYHACEPSIPDRLPWKAPNIKFVHLNGNGESMSKAIELLSSYWTEKHDTLLDFYKFKDVGTAFSEYDCNDVNKKIVFFREQP